MTGGSLAIMLAVVSGESVGRPRWGRGRVAAVWVVTLAVFGVLGWSVWSSRGPAPALPADRAAASSAAAAPSDAPVVPVAQQPAPGPQSWWPAGSACADGSLSAPFQLQPGQCSFAGGVWQMYSMAGVGVYRCPPGVELDEDPPLSGPESVGCVAEDVR